MNNEARSANLSEKTIDKMSPYLKRGNLAIQWIAFITIVTKEIRRFLRIWQQTLLPPAITMALYFVIFGTLIGERVGQMGGVDYMVYIVPGLIMMSVITNSYGNVASSFFSNKFQKSVEEMLVSPIHPLVILSGFVIGGVTRGLCVGGIVTLLSLYFAELSIQHLFVTISVLFLSAVVFSLGGFINAMFASKFDDISIVPTFIITPLTYLGGVFYSVSLLAEPWSSLSLLNPILYIVNGFRFGIIGVSDVSLTLTYGMLLFFIVVLSSFAVLLIKRGYGIRN